ncbi:MAG: hypothetical protein JSS75_06775 [Bacteroidetes bacterium]|nr:hypothetical protein [Bacteroidota bacterium]
MLLLLSAHTITAQSRNSKASVLASARRNNASVFIPNRGQLVDQYGNLMPEVLFSTHDSRVRCYLTKHSLHFVFGRHLGTTSDADEIERLSHAPSHPSHEHDSLQLTRLDMELVGANPDPTIESIDRTSSYSNFYLAQCALTHVPHYKTIVYRDVYPKIDLVVRARATGIKHEFIVHPGGDPSVIALRYAGMDSLRLTGKGDLNIATPAGLLTEDHPYCYQTPHDESGNINPEIGSGFVIERDVVRFRLDRYDHTKDLVIDPLHPAWGSYFGGTGGEEQAQSPVINRAGNIYFCGFTQSNTNIASSGAYQTTRGGGYDAYLAKFDPNGNELWSTYYGGSGDDYAGGVALDSNGDVLLFGQTSSATGIATSGVYQQTMAGAPDAFLVRFDSTGTRQWGTYYGGPAPELVNGLRSICVDHAGRIFITGTTNSSSGIASPTAYQQNLSGAGYDVFVAYFHSTGSIGWSTYYGGPGEDVGLAIAADANRNVYVGGYTSTNGSGFVTSSGAQSVYGGGSHDAFLTKFNATTGSLLWSTYLGGASDEGLGGVFVDRDSSIYICGNTASNSNIATAGSYQPNFNAGIDGYIAHYSPACKRLWSTYYGGSTADFVQEVFLDSARFYVAGRSSSTDGIAVGTTYQSANAGLFDAFLSRFTRAGTPIWTTYYGGQYTDYGYGCVIDKLENPVMAGSTLSPSGIATTGAFQTSGGGGTNRDGFVVQFCDLETPTLTNSRDTVCGDGHDTLFLVMPQTYQHIYWYDTTALLPWLTDSTSYVVSEAQLGLGKHTISVEVHNGINCMDVTNAIEFTVVPSPVVDAGIDTGTCAGGSVILTATASSGQPPYTYAWTPTIGLAGANSATPKATPTKTTTYHILVTDARGCTAEDSVTVTVHPSPVLNLTRNESICPGSSTVIGDTATGGIAPYTYVWSPVTGLSAGNIATPTASPATTTVYSVIVTDAYGCQTTGKVTVTVSSNVVPKVTPAGPVVICKTDSVVLHAQKGFATYHWSTGSTDDSIVVRQAGSYTVDVTTSSGCSGTSLPVVVTISPDPVATISPAGPVEICSGTTVTLTANAASGYLWSTGETTRSIVVSSAGNYSVTISSAAGCSATSQPVIVTIAPPVHPTIAGPTSICVGGGAENYSIPANAGSSYDWTPTNGTITSGQGTNTATIQWADATPGTASLRVIETTAGGCKDTGTLSITITAGLQPTITGGPLSFCDGDSVTLDAGAGYDTYQWKKDGTDIGGATAQTLRVGSSGAYSVAVSNTAGCNGVSASVTVTVFPTPPIPTITQTNDSLISSSASTYQWTFGGSVIPGATGQVLTPTPPGVYTVTITDANGCENTSAPLTVNPTVLASATVSVPASIVAVPGDPVQIPITLSNAVNLAQRGARNYVGVIRFNSSMLASVGSTAIGAMNGVERLVPFSGTTTPASGTLQTLDFVATLGTDSCTDVIIDTFYWTDAVVAVTRNNGTFCETGFCSSGGTVRLIDPTGILKLGQSYPNPATDIVRIDFEVIEDGVTSLTLDDLFGREVRTIFSNPLKAGPYSRTFDVSGLANGSYLYSLRTPTTVLTRIMQITH